MPIYPSTFPYDLRTKPRRLGESLVYAALQSALTDTWHIFYDWAVCGTRRRVDFLCIDPCHGVAAFEVKGGTVHKRRTSFVQQIRKNGTRKRISPFRQLKFGAVEVLQCCGIEALAVPLHLSIFFPHMSQSAYTFVEGPHFFTREDLTPAKLQAKLTPNLPVIADPVVIATLHRLIDTLVSQSS